MEIEGRKREDFENDRHSAAVCSWMASSPVFLQKKMKVAKERASEHAGCKNGTDVAGVLGPDGLRGTFVIWAKPYINKLPINRHRAAATRTCSSHTNSAEDVRLKYSRSAKTLLLYEPPMFGNYAFLEKFSLEPIDHG